MGTTCTQYLMFEYVLTKPWGIIDTKKVVEYSLNSISEQLKHCKYPDKALYVHTQLFTVQLPLSTKLNMYICDDAGW